MAAEAKDELSHARDYAGIAHKYAVDTVNGRIANGKWMKLACQRHLNDLNRSRIAGASIYFDPWHANDVCDFIEKLPHIEGKWATPTITLEAWQIFCLSVLFGWRRAKDKGRRFSKVLWEVARKNAKSTIAAGITLYCFTCEDEPAPYIFIGATTGAQAQKVFHPCAKMVEKTSALREYFGLRVWARAITEPGGGYIQTINSKGSTNDGHNTHVGILDELHAHTNRSLYDVIDSSFGARTNPLLLMITTAGFDTEGICYEQRKYATQILESVIDADHFAAFIFTLDDGDDPYDPRVWTKSNPNFGVSVQIADLEKAAAEAQAQPGKAFEYLTKRMNVWTNARGGHFNIGKWKACNGPVNLNALRSVPCWGGFDLSAVSDFTSFRLIWYMDGILYTWGKRYLPRATIEPRVRRNNVPYDRWVRTEFMGAPLITVTEGDVVDYAYVERDIREAMARYNMQAIGFDSWRAQDLCSRLMAEGAPLIEVRQGHASLSGAMEELDRRYLAGQFAHGGDEVLTWCASNVVARPDHNNNVIPSKKLSAEKIDDIAALLNAIAVSLSQPVKPKSIYEEQKGLTFV